MFSRKLRDSFPLALSLAFVFSAALVGRAEDFQGSTHLLPYEEAPIHYNEQPANDPVAQLLEKLQKGETRLKWDENLGYLPAVLEALKVPVSSQVLVFSKTSLQRRDISPENPRALYFNDDVYVGYIPGAGVMEISAADSKLGGVFYTLDQEKLRRPKLQRTSDCLSCHGSGRSMGVPGHLMRSIATDTRGELDGDEAEQMNHFTPFSERWAGWYVTGKHGGQTHRGNLIGKEAFERQRTEPNHAGNLTSLSGFFDTAKYPQGGSDITALMVLGHQTHMHNYITRLNFESRMMLATYGHIRYLKSQVNAFLRYLLFTEEPALTDAIAGDPKFATDFAASALRDPKGRSLRDLDLKTRLFRYPCSFLIYSAAFDNLPDAMREHLLQRLYDILSGKDQDAQFAPLSASDRQAILEILRATKPGLPAYWQAGAAPGLEGPKVSANLGR